jgi:hypothetical protein
MLHSIFANSPVWVHAKATSKSKNGRHAFLLIKKIALGDQFLAAKSKKIEDELATLKYNGESRSWTLDTYSERMVSLFTQSDELELLGYHGFDEQTRVTKYLNGITHEAYAPVKVLIREHPTDLAGAIRKMKNHLQDNPSLQVYKKGVGISSLKSAKRRGGRRSGGARKGRGGKGGGDITVDPKMKEDIEKRYFLNKTGFVPDDTYKKMDEVEKHVVWQIRQERDAAKGDDGTQTTVSSLSTQQSDIAKIASAVVAMRKDQKGLKRQISKLRQSSGKSPYNSDEEDLFDESEDELSSLSSNAKKLKISGPRPPGSSGRQRS